MRKDAGVPNLDIERLFAQKTMKYHSKVYVIDVGELDKYGY